MNVDGLPSRYPRRALLMVRSINIPISALRGHVIRVTSNTMGKYLCNDVKEMSVSIGAKECGDIPLPFSVK